MEQVIKKAIEGGYDPKDHYINYGSDTYAMPAIILDPLFWKALGKALGWAKDADQLMIDRKKRHWKVQWHVFIDHIARGYDADIFFNELLK